MKDYNKEEIKDILFKEAERINKHDIFSGSFDNCFYDDKTATLYVNSSYRLQYQYPTKTEPAGITLLEAIGGCYII